MAWSKMTIAWHEECLKNIRAYKESKRLEIERVRSDFDRLVYECLEYEKQIALAKEKGLDAFDRERFGKKKGE